MSISNKKTEESKYIEGLFEYSTTLALGPPDAPEWDDLELLSDHLIKLLEVRNEELEVLKLHQAEVAAQRRVVDTELEKLGKLPDRVLQFWNIADCRQWQAEQVPESDLDGVLDTTTHLINTIIDYEKTEKEKASTLQERQKLRLRRDQLERQFANYMVRMNKVFRDASGENVSVPVINEGLNEVEDNEPLTKEGQQVIEKGSEVTTIPENLQVEDALVEIADIFPAGYASESFEQHEEGELAKGASLADKKADESPEAVFLKKESHDDLDGWLIAVHSLRGGLGCTSIAVNLAIGLQNLWGYPTLLLDNDFVSGQVALMLNASAPRTWADLFATPAGELEIAELAASISFHDSGLHFLAAPANSAEKLNVNQLTVKSVLQASLKKYDYLVADLAHDFNDVTLEVLKAADRVLLVLSPEIVSVRLAATALRGYREHHFDSTKIQLVLVQNSSQSQLKENEIEKALNHSISHIIPFAPKASNWAIAAGIPFLIRDYKIPLSTAIEDLAFISSKPNHQEISPPKPSNTWKRVFNRQGSSTDNNQKGKFQLPFLKNFSGISKIAQNFDTGPLGEDPPQNKSN